MGQPIFITTPNGNVVSGGSGGNPVLNLANYTVTWNGLVESFGNAFYAQTYYNQVITAMTAVNATTPSSFIQNLTTTPVIFSISPTTYSVLNDGTFIQITGTGFTPALNNTVLCSDDNNGAALNGEGYLMLLTYVNTKLLTGVWVSNGDTILPSGKVAIYIITAVDGTILSNVLNGMSTGNKEVTVNIQ